MAPAPTLKNVIAPAPALAPRPKNSRPAFLIAAASELGGRGRGKGGGETGGWIPTTVINMQNFHAGGGGDF